MKNLIDMDFNLHSGELNRIYSKDELLKSLREFGRFKFLNAPNEVATTFDSGFFVFRSANSKIIEIVFPIEGNEISNYKVKLNAVGKTTIGISLLLLLTNIFIIATGGHLLIILSSVAAYIAIFMIFYSSVKSDAKTISKKISLKL